ncbi:MAG: DUF4020 domain-containing protein [Candidatus Zixiibacteriota bacterium]
MAARNEGKLVVFAGAGVSMGSPSDMPSYLQLAQELTRRCGEEWPEKLDTIDRYLGELESKHPDIRQDVYEIFKDPSSKPNELHFALLKLFRTPADVKLVTTNYDIHFSTASRDLFGEEIKRFEAPALPQGDNFRGIVHVHGCIDQELSQLVLTSRDFARAYLTRRWATRFIEQLVREYRLLYVGYSLNDPFMQYIAEALGEETRHFVMLPRGSNKTWERYGMKPIFYPLTDGSENHEALVRTIVRWSKRETERTSYLTLESHVKEMVVNIERDADTRAEQLSAQTFQRFESTLHQEIVLRYFCRYATNSFWLSWLDEHGIISRLFEQDSELNEREKLLAGWFADNFVTLQGEAGLVFLRKKGTIINPTLWTSIVWNLAHGKNKPEPGLFAKWISAVLDSAPQERHQLQQLNHVLLRNMDEAHCQSIMLLFEFLTRPTPKLKQIFSLEPTHGGDEIGLEIDMIGETHYLQEAWKKHFRPSLTRFAGELASIFTFHFRQARRLLVAADQARDGWDPVSWSRSAIEEHEQDRHKYGFEISIDFAREAIEFLLKAHADQADALIHEWSSSGVPLLRRLAIHARRMSSHMSPDEKLRWLLAKNWLYTYGLKHEVFQLLKSTFSIARVEVQAAIVVRVQEGSNRVDEERKDISAYEVYNLLYWLTEIAPDCKAARDALEATALEHPRFKPREYPDLDSWTSGTVHLVGDSPIGTEDLLSREPSEWVDYLLTYEGDRFEGPSREALLNRVGQAAKGKPSWGLGLAMELLAKRIWNKDVWESLLYAWDETDFDEAMWYDVLEILNADAILQRFVARVSHVLWNGTEKKRIPASLLDKAEDIAERAWRLCDLPEPEQSQQVDWLFEAINHPAGQLTLFWLQTMSIRLRSVNGDEKAIPETYRSRLAGMVDGVSYACQLARVMLASQLKFLFSLDSNWTRDHILPLLDWTVDPGRAEQCWHGFIAWGQLSRELLDDLKPLYEQAVAKFPPEPSRIREHLVQHAASMALSLERPLEGGWLNTLIRNLKRRKELGIWATMFRYQLSPLPEEVRRKIWGAWLREYWCNRIDGIPFGFEEDELRNMFEWALELEPVFEDVVDTICRSPIIDPGHTNIYKDLIEEELANSHPVSVSKLFLHLLNGIQGVLTPQHGYLCDDMASLFEELRRSGAPLPELKAIAEEIGRIGCPQAIDLGNSLETD